MSQDSRSLSLHHRHELEVGSKLTPGIIEQRGYFTVTTREELTALGYPLAQEVPLPALALPLYSPHDLSASMGCQVKPDAPRNNDRGKPIKYETPYGWKMRFDVCPNPGIRKLVADPTVPLFITEGIKKGDSAAVQGLPCIALLGVYNWRGQNDLGGFTALGDWESVPIKNRTIYIVFDNDVMFKEQVQGAIKRLAEFLKSRGASEVLCIVPALPGHDGKLGLDDFFAAGGTKDQLLRCVDHGLLSRPRQRKVKTNGRPLADVCKDALDALVEFNNVDPHLFVRSGELVRIAKDRSGPKIKTLDVHRMRGILMRSNIQWLRTIKTKDGFEETDVPPPTDVVYDLLTHDAWPTIPTLINVTRSPILSPSGTLSMKRGYCPESEIYIDSEGDWPEFEGTNVDAVRYIFDEIFAEFPFVSPSDRAHALALMLLPIVRSYIQGPTPIHLLDAPTPGTGKSLLAKSCLMVATGTDVGSTPSGGDDEAEWRKFISAALLDGATVIFYDNVERKVDSPALENALTSPEWVDRKLQQTEIVRVPIRCTWVMTTNNAELGKAITRRTLYIHLDARTENPEERPIKKKDLERWVRDNRLMIIAALCKIVQSWINAGLPRYTGKQWGSYEEYTSVMGGILEHSQVTGFLDNVDDLRSKGNSDHASWAEFVKRWWDAHQSNAVTAGDILGLFKQDESLSGWLGSQEAGHAAKLGRLLRKRADQVFSGLQIKIWTGTRTNSTRYHLVPTTSDFIWNPIENASDPIETRLFENEHFEPEEESSNRDNRDNRDIPRVTRAHAYNARDACAPTPHEENPIIPIIPTGEPENESGSPPKSRLDGNQNPIGGDDEVYIV